jgi:hypothetical protein
MLRSILAVALLVAAVATSAAPLTKQDLDSFPDKKLPSKELEANLPDSHPMAYFFYAAKLYRAGKQDQATKWYYVGLIRFRQHLLAHPDLPADGDAAQFENAKKAFGPAITDWAGGNIRIWLQTINDALAWDANNPNAFTSKETYAQQLALAREEVSQAHDKIKTTQNEIKADRASRGLTDR